MARSESNQEGASGKIAGDNGAIVAGFATSRANGCRELA
jgi:hypothetical protein